MKVLIVAPKFVRQPGEFYQFPLGLGYISAALKAKGHDVVCLNANLSALPVGIQVEEAVRKFGPDMCASGALSPYLPQIQQIFKAARKARPGIFNVAGGGVLSSDPEAGPILMDIDAGVIGEGEETIVELCEAWETHGDLSRVAGIVFSHNGKIRRTANRPAIMDLGSIPWPDYDGFKFGECIDHQLPNDNYFFHPFNSPRSLDMISSRSCPYYCTFCFHPSGKVYRERPLDDFFAELEFRVKQYNLNQVAVLDELFSLKKSRLLEFCDRMKPFNLNWMVQLHVSSGDEHILERMKESGCTYISFGIESMSQPVLASMKKKSKVERIDDVLRRTYQRKIGIQGNLIFGDTAETLDTANSSMNWWMNNRHLAIYINRLQVYPGSPDYIEAVRDGLIDDRTSWIRRGDIHLNISQMNDFDAVMMGKKLYVAQKTLLNDVTPIHFIDGAVHPVRGPTYDILWDCPRCGNCNDYRSVQLDLPEDEHAVRLSCRGCLSRFDIRRERVGEARKENALGRVISRARWLAYVGQRAARRYRSGNFTFRPKDFPQVLAAARILLRGNALLQDPFNPARHVAYAEALLREGSFGMARAHFERALILAPGNSEAERGLQALEGAGLAEDDLTRYFVSYTSALAPQRPVRKAPVVYAHQKKLGEDFPDIRGIEAKRRAAE